MKRWNVLAAGLIAATFVSLSLVPLTRGALRFDMQLAAGQPLLGSTLLDLGLKQSDMPFGGAGPALVVNPTMRPSGSTELPVRVAETLMLSGRVKWSALQALAAEAPQEPAVHAALARMACKNGGAVGVGHQALQDELSPPQKSSYTSTPNPDEAGDAVIMLRSCAAGERLDPDNAYFPAMAAVGHLSLNQDREAQAALHRAVEKPRWYEYIDVEAAGRVRHAELVSGPQNSLTKSASYAGILFPHYAALRGMARVFTAQAMHLEQAGDLKAGLALRHETAQLGAKMRGQSSSLIGGLVGTAMVRVAEGRPAGAPVLKTEDDASRQQSDTRFLEFVTRTDPAQVAWWQKELAAGATCRAIVKNTDASAFGAPTLFETQWKLMASLALLSAVVLLCTLSGLAYLQPWLGRRVGHLAPFLALAIFLGVAAWGAWQGLGNFRNFMALTALFQGLAGDGSSSSTAIWNAVTRTLYGEWALIALALLTPLVYLGVVAFPKRGKHFSVTTRLCQSALPIAALLTVVYTIHLTSFCLRERTVEHQLQQVLAHEGRTIAQAIGQTWPD